MKIRTNKGFSLLEILLVITLLSILFAILVTRVNPRNIIYITEDNQREADALTIYQALEQYAIKNNAYPESIKNMPNNSSLYICKTSASNCTNSNQINLSTILVPTYFSKIPEHSTDTNNSGFYVVKDINGKIGIGGIRILDDTTFVKGIENQSFIPSP
jgi:prepilin-type N-terminal cleavage/methylation domain-containing protein